MKLEVAKDLTFTAFDGKGKEICKNERLRENRWWNTLSKYLDNDYHQFVKNEPDYGFMKPYLDLFLSSDNNLLSYLTTLDLLKNFGSLIESIEKIRPGFFEMLYGKNFKLITKTDQLIYNNSIILSNVFYHLCDMNAKKIWDKLGLTKEIFYQLLEEKNPTIKLMKIKEIKASGYSAEAIKNLITTGRLEDRFWLSFKTDLEQSYYNFLAENNYPILESEEIRNLTDYIRMLNDVHLAGRTEYKFRMIEPKNIQKVHDEIVQVYNETRNQAEYARHQAQIDNYINKIYPKLAKYDFEDENMIVYAPKSVTELDTEGMNMHHCVGGYKWEVANGNTCIYFLRKKENPTSSYVTIEIKDVESFHMVQKRAKYNNAPEEYANTFIDKWFAHVKELKEKEKEEKLKKLEEAKKAKEAEAEKAADNEVV